MLTCFVKILLIRSTSSVSDDTESFFISLLFLYLSIKFDTKLDLENKKLDKLHIIKKSLLQQMFI